MTEQHDLFALANGPMLTPGQRKRLSTRSNKHGHVAPPGTGPEGETCGTCKNLCRIKLANTFFKCGLRRATWTGSYGTDVRCRDLACRKWEAAE